MKSSLHFIFLFMCIQNLFANLVIDNLFNEMKEKQTLVCVGLDPDINKMPHELLKNDLSDEENAFNFLREIIEITSPYVCCYKAQKAFFDAFEKGHDLLKSTISYIKKNYPKIPVFIDCKIGDIDNTMNAYIKLLFNDLNSDGIVVNPYMGDDVFIPFIEDKQKVAIVLIQTSNIAAKAIQELRLESGKMLWEELLNLMLKRWNVNNNLIPILSSNCDINNYKIIREKLPNNMPILLAGIGAQGGNYNIMQQILNDERSGVFVNSSRGVRRASGIRSSFATRLLSSNRSHQRKAIT